MIKSYKRAIQFRSGIKLSIEESLFDLGNLEPQENMDIYITVQGNRFTCFKPTNYLCHFIGNVKDDFGSGFGKRYSIYINSIVKGDRKLARGSVELNDSR